MKLNEASSRILAGESPDSICGDMRRNNQWTVSTATLYRYIDNGYIPGVTNRDLWEKTRRKRTYNKVKAAKRPPAGVSIERRPKEINKRETFGHWEMDCVIGKAKGKGQAVLVLTERLTRYELIFKLTVKNASSVNRKVQALINKLPPDAMKSITVDNGSEFSSAFQLPVPVYYCHPYTSSERGSNENCNRIIRRYLRKGSSFQNVTQAQCEAVAAKINNMHRKLLGYCTSSELFSACISQI